MSSGTSVISDKSSAAISDSKVSAEAQAGVKIVPKSSTTCGEIGGDPIVRESGEVARRRSEKIPTSLVANSTSTPSGIASTPIRTEYQDSASSAGRNFKVLLLIAKLSFLLYSCFFYQRNF